MNAFDEALDQFHRNGCFIYKSACLNTDHITKLKDSLAELDLSNTYQFHLSDVRLDPYTTQPTVAPVLKMLVVLLLLLNGLRRLNNSIQNKQKLNSHYLEMNLQTNY